MEQIEVFPDKKGSWHTKDASGKVSDHENRREAIASARKLANGQVRVVLLRPDGSEYGELDASPSTAVTAQHVELEPAGENNEGVG